MLCSLSVLCISDLSCCTEDDGTPSPVSRDFSFIQCKMHALWTGSNHLSNFFQEFYANRPYIYFIREKTSGTILFLGRYVTPPKAGGSIPRVSEYKVKQFFFPWIFQSGFLRCILPCWSDNLRRNRKWTVPWSFLLKRALCQSQFQQDDPKEEPAPDVHRCLFACRTRDFLKSVPVVPCSVEDLPKFNQTFLLFQAASDTSVKSLNMGAALLCVLSAVLACLF